MLQIFIGYDEREIQAYNVLRNSIRLNSKGEIQVSGIFLSDCRMMSLYTRPTIKRRGHLWDIISNAGMSTEFAISRFLTPFLADPGEGSWALYMDCDMLVRCDISSIQENLNEEKSIYCVQHPPSVGDVEVKMDGCNQLPYPRKNWSSVMLFNLRKKSLTLEMINTWSGLRLHRFDWLVDQDIGCLDKCWNHLVGVDDPNPDAKIVHYTLGTPNLCGYKSCEYAEEWMTVRNAVSNILIR